MLGAGQSAPTKDMALEARTLQTARPGEGSEKQPFTEVNKSTSIVNVELAFWLSGRPALNHSAC